MNQMRNIEFFSPQFNSGKAGTKKSNTHLKLVGFYSIWVEHTSKWSRQ